MSENRTTSIPIELLKKYDKPGPRYTSYPTAPIWTDKIGNKEYAEDLKEASEHSDKTLSIYTHIPFCKKRCFYCGCNTCITNEKKNSDDYIEVICKEITKTSSLLAPRKKISQLHFGGGTPTFLDIEGLGKILDCYDASFDFIEGCEKSIEVDPRVTSEEQLDYLASRGFNRVSIGVQDFDPEVQKASGRVQTDELVAAVLDKCRSLNFKGINFDLIYGLPRQTAESFKATIEKAIKFRPDRLAVYSFAYLPDLKSNQAKIIEDELPITEIKYQLFADSIEKFTAAGYRQIGMDHFALPDDELSVAQTDGRLHRNFMGYTVQASEEMIGIGMSSIGYINNAFFQNLSKINSYKEEVNSDDFAVYRGMRLSNDDLIRQFLIQSLMCNFHFSFASMKEKFNVDYHEYFKEEHPNLKEFVEDGFMTIDDNSLNVTPLGRTFVRNISMTYDAYLKGDKKATFSRTI